MNRKAKVRIWNIIVVLLLLGGLTYVVCRFLHLGNVEFTDNAYVHQHITPVNSRVEGFIKEIRFDEYTPVHKGDTLIIIEDSEFRLQVAQAESALANARVGRSASDIGVATTSSNIAVSEAAIAESKVNLDNARTEDERYRRLLERNAVTQQQYDNVHTAYLAAQARHEQLVRSRQSTALVRNEQSQRLSQGDAGVNVAQAQLDLARLNLSYTVILAPCDGVLGRKDINVGQLIMPGQTLVDIVDSSDKWIIANYREKQLHHINVGDSVQIHVDAVPDSRIMGVVQSISDATGSAVSLIPTDNTTGNFVKVEQRIPVRIRLLPESAPDVFARMSAGMSVECEVKY